MHFFFPFPQVQKKLPFLLQGPWRSVCSSEMWAAATSLRAELTATTQSVPNTPGPVTTGSGSSRYVRVTAVTKSPPTSVLCNTLLSFSGGVVVGEGLPHICLGFSPTQLWRGRRGQLLCAIPGYSSTCFMSIVPHTCRAFSLEGDVKSCQQEIVAAVRSIVLSSVVTSQLMHWKARWDLHFL